MKKLLGIVVLGLLLSLSAKADDIRDFEIEGISLNNKITPLRLENILSNFGIKVNLTNPSSEDFFDSSKNLTENYQIKNYVIKNSKKVDETLLFVAHWKKNFEDIDLIYEVLTFNSNVKNFDELMLTFVRKEYSNERALINISAVTNFDLAPKLF